MLPNLETFLNWTVIIFGTWLLSGMGQYAFKSVQDKAWAKPIFWIMGIVGLAMIYVGLAMDLKMGALAGFGAPMLMFSLGAATKAIFKRPEPTKIPESPACCKGS